MSKSKYVKLGSLLKLPLQPLSILYYEFFNKEIKTPLLIFW